MVKINNFVFFMLQLLTLLSCGTIPNESIKAAVSSKACPLELGLLCDDLPNDPKLLFTFSQIIHKSNKYSYTINYADSLMIDDYTIKRDIMSLAITNGIVSKLELNNGEIVGIVIDKCQFEINLEKSPPPLHQTLTNFLITGHSLFISGIWTELENVGAATSIQAEQNPILFNEFSNYYQVSEKIVVPILSDIYFASGSSNSSIQFHLIMDGKYPYIYRLIPDIPFEFQYPYQFPQARLVDDLQDLLMEGDINAIHVKCRRSYESGLRSGEESYLCADTFLNYPDGVDNTMQIAKNMFLSIIKTSKTNSKYVVEPWQIGWSFVKLGDIYAIQGNIEKAVYYYNSAQYIAATLNSVISANQGLFSLGIIKDARSSWEKISTSNLDLYYSSQIDFTKVKKHADAMQIKAQNLSKWLEIPLTERIVVYVYANKWEGTNFGLTLGFTERKRRTIHMSIDQTLGHELVHAILGLSESPGKWTVADKLVQEGLASYLDGSERNFDQLAISDLQKAKWPDFMRLRKTCESFSGNCYFVGASFVSYLVKLNKTAFLRVLHDPSSLKEGLYRHYGESGEELVAKWQESLKVSNYSEPVRE